MVFDDVDTARFDVLRLLSEKSAWPDGFFESVKISVRISLSVWVIGKETGGDLVDASVRALSRQDGRHQKFERITEPQFDPSLWVGFRNTPDDLAGMVYAWRFSDGHTKDPIRVCGVVGQRSGEATIFGHVSQAYIRQGIDRGRQ